MAVCLNFCIMFQRVFAVLLAMIETLIELKTFTPHEINRNVFRFVYKSLLLSRLNISMRGF